MEIYNQEDLRDFSIGMVLRADNHLKPDIIVEHSDYLDGVDFIFVDENKGTDLISPVLNMFGINNGKMCSVFHSNKLRIMNIESLKGVKKGFDISYDIGMETQIVSYISRYLEGTLDNDLISVISPLQIKRNLATEINVDAYVFENCGIKKEFTPIEIRNIWSVFYFYNLPIMDSASASIKADISVKEIQTFIEKAQMTSRYIERYYLCYCALLKIIILKFSNLSTKNKVKELVNFENNDICTSAAMFLNIAEAFWRQGTNIRFFGKIQKGKKDILKIIKNMAWDLFHWIHTSLNFNFSYHYRSDISIPLIYSIDSRFLELTKYAKIDGVAIDNKSKISYPYCNTDVLKNYFSQDEQLVYFGADALHKRNQNRKNVDTIQLCEKLEKDLLEMGVFGI